MFSYYGSKSKLVDLYPAPKFKRIIEPFAGSARYALKYWDRDVLLIDKYPVIIKIWEYLKQASVSDIMGLPEPSYKENIEKFNLCDGEKNLLSFLVARGVANPQYTVQKFSDIAGAKKQIAKQLEKIRHWKFVLGDYRCVENVEATWFIDPPYQFGGEWYHISNAQLDYTELSTYCQTRQGQVIVCENTKADWLNFNPIGKQHGAYSDTMEAIWCNDVQQLAMTM